MTTCEEKNRHFFVNGTVQACKWRAKNRMPFHGKYNGSGKLGELIRFIGKYNEAIKCQLEVRMRDLHLVKPMHSTDIHVCISEIAMQVRTRNKRILSSASYYCIIADVWSYRYSKKEYCSTSLKIVIDKLKCDTIFL